MLPVKNRFPNCDFRGGPDITTFGFVTDTYIHTYIDRYIQGLPKRPILQASKLLNHNR